jgi:DNA-binding SARP family transcriptional activator
VPHAAIDANRFVEQIRRGAQLVWHSPAEAVERLRSALLLWRGPAVFKANSGVRRQAAAAVLDECHVMAQEDLIVAQLLLGRHREVLSELRGLTAQHPERERLAELLMIALYQSGRQTESLNEFHRARRLLRERFGVEPGPGLHRLQRVILQRQTGIGTLLGQPLDRAPVPAGLQ